MKVVIMAGGKGTRMRPLTYDTPKCLIEVNGKPFLYYVIKRLKQAGFSDFGIIYMDKENKWADFLEKYNVDATLIHQPNPQGTAHAVECCKDFVGLEDFVVVNGDNLYGVKDYQNLMKQDEFCYAGGMKSEHPELYGVLFHENGFLKKIVEKPKKFIGDFVNIGLYKFTNDIFEAIDKIELSPRGEYEITDALTLLGGQNKAKVLKVEEMVDFGKLEDIPKMELYLSKE